MRKEGDNKIIKKTVIIAGYSCNNNCLFCIDANKRGLKNKNTLEIEKEIWQAKGRGSTYLEFIGGEMTIRKDFLRLVKVAYSAGFKTIMIATNGRMVSYKDYAKKLVEAGLTNIVFSIHGHNDKTHDYLTRAKGSFRQLKEGVKNMQELLGGDKLGSNTTLVNYNYKNTKKIGQYILGLGIRNAEFIFVDCNEGGAKNNFKEMVPRISEAAPYIRECLDLGQRQDVVHWHIRYVPLCFFTDYLDQISEIDEVAHFKTEHIAPDFINLNVEDSRKSLARIKTERCSGCLLFDKCEGIWREYFKHYGDKELIAIKQ